MIRLPTSIRGWMIRDLLGRLPEEGCGFLLGIPDTRTVARWWHCHNIHPEPARSFTIDPADQRDALVYCEKRGVRVLALVHSHPTAHAVPSADDLRHPIPDGWDSVIVSFADQPERASLRAWQVLPDAVVESIIIPD